MRVPIATYRLQFNPFFGFVSARGIIPYLAGLGITDIYVSPIFRARSGSLHGYDILDPNKLSPELGKQTHFRKLVKKLKVYRLGWLQDIVPNHMAYDYQNQMLRDVLENGESSRYFDFFDIEWNQHKNKKRLLAPFLEKPYRESLRKGWLKLSFGESGLAVNYRMMKLPIKIESYAKVIFNKLDELKTLGEDQPDLSNFIEILDALNNLGPKSKNRDNLIISIKRNLWKLYNEHKGIKKFVDKNIDIYNGRRGNPRSFNLLDDLLSEQLFKLSSWKSANKEINFRRFFHVNDLISLKMEKESVFLNNHRLVLELVKNGTFGGLRLDHIDGLYDPAAYIKKLREKLKDTYIIVEKILNLEEYHLPFWPIQGTTGYDFLDVVNGIFCYGENEMKINKIYTDFSGLKKSYSDLLYEKKKLIIKKHMSADIDNLACLVADIPVIDKLSDQFKFCRLRKALEEIMISFSVYRTYINQDTFDSKDELYIKDATCKARLRNPNHRAEIDFIERLLLLKFPKNITGARKRQWIHFVMKFQQFTVPLMAKGFEDTFLYVYNRLISLNEVGSSPNKFGFSLEEFHNFNENRLKHWPHSLNATSTHDTKRGEDVRARINVLSELPQEWRSKIKIWSKINRKKKSTSNGEIPDKNMEYFIYQSLLGAFPLAKKDYSTFTERIKEYMIKSAREAKVHTTWLKPNQKYEDGLISFVASIMKTSKDNRFLEEFLPFQKKIAHYGVFNSLSQTLLKITSPGVPDIYQGAELWDLNLVDPDNRRPVDFERRKLSLFDVKNKERINILSLIVELLSTKEDGRIKLFLIYKALNTLKENQDVFQKGSYAPISTGGKFRGNVVSFVRSNGRKRAIIVVPRFLTALVENGQFPLGQRVWDNTYIAVPRGFPSLWKNVITAQVIKADKIIPVGEILRHFPVALLMGDEKT